MTKLSVNINKVATIRNARGESEPNVYEFALNAERYGAQGITVHPRPDERHITYLDVVELSAHFPNKTCEFNIEGYPTERFMDLVLQSKPTQVTLVPDAPNVLTSHEGWDTIKNADLLTDVISTFQKEKIRVSLFMDTDLKLIEKAKELNTDRIEFYTGHFARKYKENPTTSLDDIRMSYEYCLSIGLDMNAGHDLNRENLAFFIKELPEIKEVSIGHALISDCLYFGLENVIPMYARLLV